MLLRVLIVFGGLLSGGAAAAETRLEIHHIDVDQGDATLIVAEAGEERVTVLIDAGNKGKGNSHVLPYLHKQGIARLDTVIASHFDADHIGGLDEVIDGLRAPLPPVLVRGKGERIKISNTDQARELFVAAGCLDDQLTSKDDADGVKRKHLSAAGCASERLIVVSETTRIALAGDARMIPVVGNGCIFRPKPDCKSRLDENGASLGFVITLGSFDYVTAGDLTGGGPAGGRFKADLETPLAARVGDVDVLRINHHGSHTSSNAEFLRVLAPEVAVISVGGAGSPAGGYEHPRLDVLARLDALADGGPLQRVFLTNAGYAAAASHIEGNEKRRALYTAAADDAVVLTVDGDRYTIHGGTYPTDGRRSAVRRRQVAAGRED